MSCKNEVKKYSSLKAFGDDDTSSMRFLLNQKVHNAPKEDFTS